MFACQAATSSLGLIATISNTPPPWIRSSILSGDGELFNDDRRWLSRRYPRNGYNVKEEMNIRDLKCWNAEVAEIADDFSRDSKLWLNLSCQNNRVKPLSISFISFLKDLRHFEMPRPITRPERARMMIPFLPCALTSTSTKQMEVMFKSTRGFCLALVVVCAV